MPPAGAISLLVDGNAHILGGPLDRVHRRRQLVRVQESGTYVAGMDSGTDCYSLYSTLRNADLVRPTDDSLIVYIAALR